MSTPQHDTNELSEQALAALEQGELSQAKALYEQICRVDAEDAHAWMMSGAIAGELGETTDAIIRLRRALELRPDLAEAHVSLGNVLRMQGNLEDAISSYQRALDLQADYPEAWGMLGELQLRLGRTAESESACRKVIALRPDAAEAHFVLGSALEGQGRLDEAIACYRRAAQLRPDYAEAFARQAMLLHSKQVRDEAEQNYRQALRLNPNQPLIHFNFGVLLQEMERFGEAEQSYRQALKIQLDYAAAHANLGYVLRMQGKPEAAMESYQQALRINPGAADIHYTVGLLFQELGQFEAAAASYRQALRVNPGSAKAYAALGSVLQVVGKYEEALNNYLQALRIDPEYVEALLGQGATLNALGRQDEALSIYQKALEIDDDNVETHIGMAAVLMTLQMPDQAVKHCMRALEINPDHVDATALAANIADHTGDKQKAYEFLSPLLKEETGQINILLAFALISKALDREAEAIARLERLLETNRGLTASAQSNVHFTLGKLYDSTGDYDKAFYYFRQGNESKQRSFDPVRHAAEVDTLISVYSPAFMSNMPRASVRSDKPVFVVGMARSGTSLVEQILASHPLVYGAGELRDITKIVTSLHGMLGTGQLYPQCLPLLTQNKIDMLARHYLDRLDALAPDAARVIDKMPGNFMHLGLIELLFPDARIIHTMRDPLDVCISCYFQDFSRSHPYSYNLTNLGAFYRGYRRLMQHWRSVLSIPMMEIRYEDLINDQEANTRALVEFCGLEWDEQCLNFHTTQRYVGTASYDQVRQPMYKGSAGRWKNYERYISPLVEALKE